MLTSLLSLNFRRKRLLRTAPPGIMHDFYATPFAATKAPCNELEFIALDLETTGLDPQRNEILSIGLVRLQGLEIDLQSASHRLIRPQSEVPEQSAVIHQITDDRAATGEPLRKVLEEVLPLLAGRVLIAHHARFEMQFLQQACERCFGTGFLMPVIDTQAVARRTLERRSQTYKPQQLRLAEVRRVHGLPQYRLHNALSDALAAGELFLAQLAQYDVTGQAALKNFLLKV